MKIKTVVALLAGVAGLVSAPLHAQPVKAGFSSITATSHVFLSLDAGVFDPWGDRRSTQLPPGSMAVVSSTNLATPRAQWATRAQAGTIGSTVFALPYSAGKPREFFSLTAVIPGDFDQTLVPPYELRAAGLRMATNVAVTFVWPNVQPGYAPEREMILAGDASNHAYLVNSTFTSGSSGSMTIEMPTTNGLRFSRYTAAADTPGDLYLPPASNIVSLDWVTIPYVCDTNNTGRTIMQVAAYDMTDPAYPQYLGEVAGDGSEQGTLEIPAMSLWPGELSIECRSTDTGYGESATTFTVTNRRTLSVVSPALTMEGTGSSRIAAATAGDAMTFQAVTSATNGTWVVDVYDPDGSLHQHVTAPMSSVGNYIAYNDGGEPAGGYPVAYREIQLHLDLPQPPDQPLPLTNRFKIWASQKRGNGRSITGFDRYALPTGNSDRQFALQVLRDGLSTVGSFTCQPVDLPNGMWRPSSDPVAAALDQPFAWTALNAGLAGKTWQAWDIVANAWSTNTPDGPVNILAIDGHGGTNATGASTGIQGPDTLPDAQLTKDSLEKFGFNKKTNGLAMAVITGCRVGDGPFMKFILRNSGEYGQVDDFTRVSKGVRWNFGLGWKQDVPIGFEQYAFISWWCFWASYLSGGSGFQYTLDDAVQRALSSAPGNGGNGVIWSGTAGMTLDKTVN